MPTPNYNPSQDWGALPVATRRDVIDEIVALATRTKIQKTPPRHMSDNRVQIDASEHRNLIRIAEMVKRLRPAIELAGIPVHHLSEWEALGEAFAALEGADWIGDDARIAELRKIRDDTSD